MGRIDRTVLAAIAAILLCVAAGAALYYANDWLLSGILSVSIVAWLAGVLAAIYGRADRRPLVLGAVIASCLYVVCAVGPWFQANVGPWLVTTRALTYYESNVLGNQPPQVVKTLATPNWNLIATNTYGSSGMIVQPQVGLAYVGTTAPPSASNLVATGHWLCGWLAAAFGAGAAAWMVRRRPCKDLPPNPPETAP